MLRLRELCRSDMETINEWRSRRDMINCLGAPYRFINIDVDEAWYQAYLANRANTVRCAVVDSNNPVTVLGLATLASIDWVNRSCEFHIMIGPDSQEKGIGTFALSEMLRHAFLDMGLRRVELGVLESNQRAISLYKKAGFSQEGVKREAILKEGRYTNLIMMGLLRDDWNEASPSSV